MDLAEEEEEGRDGVWARHSCSAEEVVVVDEAHNDATAVDDTAAFAAQSRGLVSAVIMVVATCFREGRKSESCS